MILVHLGATHLVDGYHAIRRAETELPSKWRSRIKAAQARRMQAKTASSQPRAAFLRRPALLLAASAGGFLFAAATCLGSAWARDAVLALSFLGLSTGLAFISFGFGAAGVVFLLRQKPGLVQQPVSRPIHPIQPWVGLLPRWRAALRGKMPTEAPYTGYEGELDFIQRLTSMDLPGYVFYRLQQRRGEDLDIVYVGPKGIWVFEVKHWKDIAQYKNGVWKHIKFDEPAHQWIEEEVKQPLHEQWKRGAGDLVGTIQRRAKAIPAKTRGVLEVHGGILFSYDGMRMDLQQTPPVECHTTRDWLQRLAQSPDMPGYTEMVGLQIVEALLVFHNIVCSEPAPLRNMETHAHQLIRVTEQELARLPA